MKWILILVIALFASKPVYALKQRVYYKPAVRSGGSIDAVSYSSAKLNRPARSVDITFKNLDRVSKVNYELSYTANGIPQGAIGTLTPSGSSDARNLYFGTCSKGVCTPHTIITNAQLTVKTTLNSGGVNTKRYRIKW